MSLNAGFNPFIEASHLVDKGLKHLYVKKPMGGRSTGEMTDGAAQAKGVMLGMPSMPGPKPLMLGMPSVKAQPQQWGNQMPTKKNPLVKGSNQRPKVHQRSKRQGNR